MATYIYCLSDPISKEIRYIGKTNNIRSRYLNHLQTKGKTTHVASWVKHLQSKNINPTIDILEEFKETDNWEFWEEFYISLYKSWGFSLTNLTSGGIGIKGKGYSKKLRSKINNSKRKSIFQYDLNNNFIREWSSITEASNYLKIDASGIIKSCKKQRKTSGNFLWEYK